MNARKPAQGRSRERMERVLAAAEALLLDVGPEQASIPDIAARSGVPRASIYQFFPNKYALFLAIGDTHLTQVGALIEQIGATLAGQPLPELIRAATGAVSDYYNAHPVASMLILGGPMSRTAYLSQEVTIQDIGRQMRGLLESNQPGLVFPSEPDAITLAVEIAFACMRYSYFAHGRITEAMCDQAAVAAQAYLREVGVA
ncbi:MAG: TetR/AcrR family transcriptional regulator [Marinobacter sp.]|nr:TetR/AcrR family transcriptional regulator [Marinobacter sp.]